MLYIVTWICVLSSWWSWETVTPRQATLIEYRAKASYERLRIRYKEAGIGVQLVLSKEERRQLNNSIHYVNTSRAGTFQQLERILPEAAEKREEIEQMERRISTQLHRVGQVMEQTEQNSPAILAAYIHYLQREYALALTGGERRDKRRVLSEFRAALRSYESCESIAIFPKELIQRADAILAKATFSTLDRAQFYRDYLRPIIQRIDADAALLFSTDFAISPLLRHEQPTEEQLALGQLLFFDPILSGNNKRSCASCHKPQKAFSDGRVTSRGFRFTHDLKRNAPGLLNSGLARRFGYGLEKSDMRAQVNFVLHAAEELNTNMDEVRAKLRTVPAYVQLFQQAFPSATVDIDSTHLIDALAYFTASLRSGDSAFDRYMKGTSNAITEAVAAGYNLFMGKGDCGTCHLAPVFGGYDVFSETDRPQVGHIVDAADRGMAGAWNDYFKVPSLRNLAATAPYFHHGQVIATTDLPTYLFRDDALDEVEQAQIMAFIQCLDDNPYEDMEEVVQLPPSDMYQRRSGGMY